MSSTAALHTGEVRAGRFDPQFTQLAVTPNYPVTAAVCSVHILGSLPYLCLAVCMAGVVCLWQECPPPLCLWLFALFTLTLRYFALWLGLFPQRLGRFAL